VFEKFFKCRGSCVLGFYILFFLPLNACCFFIHKARARSLSYPMEIIFLPLSIAIAVCKIDKEKTREKSVNIYIILCLFIKRQITYKISRFRSSSSCICTNQLSVISKKSDHLACITISEDCVL